MTTDQSIDLQKQSLHQIKAVRVLVITSVLFLISSMVYLALKASKPDQTLNLIFPLMLLLSFALMVVNYLYVTINSYSLLDIDQLSVITILNRHVNTNKLLRLVMILLIPIFALFIVPSLVLELLPWNGGNGYQLLYIPFMFLILALLLDVVTRKILQPYANAGND